jgi:hypothetical protein
MRARYEVSRYAAERSSATMPHMSAPPRSPAGVLPVAALAWSWCTATVAVAVTRVVMAVADPASSDGSSAPRVPGGGWPVALFEATTLAAIAVTGALVASRKPRNPIGWMLSGVAFFLGLLILSAHLYWALTLGEAEPDDLAVLVAWFASWIWIPAMIPVLLLFPLYFPTGRPPTRRWRWIEWLVAVVVPGMFVSQAFTAGPLEDYPVDNPVGASGGWETVVEAVGGIAFAAMLVGMVGAATSLVVRFRRSSGDERLQIKGVASAAVLFVVIFLFPSDYVAGEDAGFASLLVGILVLAVAVAVSVLKYRLYDIDVVINRALVYGSLTAILAGVYVGSVLLLQLALSSLTQGSGLAVAASTLAVAALFGPARARIQRAVDHRFFRSRYDAALTLGAFATRLRDEVDLDELSVDLRAVVEETMRPTHVSLWLRDVQGKVR